MPADAVKVSVIVPVFNPGEYIDDCIASLLGQSLKPHEYEAIFVDDGSTDGTGQRLDRLAERHEQVRVEHIPNSGWPGRPRNVGIDMARGEFLYFVDNDDWLTPKALERLYEMATRDRSDIVIGKVVGHGGRSVSRALFERNRSGVTVDWPMLMRLLTPHKLFRKSFLDEHGLRFPEGRRRLEDHVLVTQAYFRTERISILADYPCYHWVVRGADTKANASLKRFDAASYYGHLREVLDVVDENTRPGELRDRLYLQWYRGKVLARLGPSLLDRDQEHRREIHAEVKRLALERFSGEIDAALGFKMRVRADLLKRHAYEDVERLAAFEEQLHVRPVLRSLELEDDELVLRLRLTMQGRDEPLLFHKSEGRLRWAAPAWLARLLGKEALVLSQPRPPNSVDVFVRGPDQTEYSLPIEKELRLPAAGEEPGVKSVRLDVEARLSRRTGAAGAPLPRGDWEVWVKLGIAGFASTSRVRRRGGDDDLTLRLTRGGRLVEAGLLRRRIEARSPLRR